MIPFFNYWLPEKRETPSIMITHTAAPSFRVHYSPELQQCMASSSTCISRLDGHESATGVEVAYYNKHFAFIRGFRGFPTTGSSL